ncbi:MAG: hypothetical protein CME63_00350 [Halobacteriovoraceae bacterium]|nr:hypothetical protein [Halobacteriovoraceae bacterium]|tara:strand:+ start:151134 stop:151673 length:540 start_codon:yes stop_codon:yes gene_type:complete
MKKKTYENENGQSTIEFLITLTVALGLLFSFFKMAIIYTNGYFVHYVVYQASRAYMVGERHSNSPEGSDGEAQSIAQSVFDSYNLSGIISGFDGDLEVEDPISNGTPSTNLFVGVRTNFTQKLLIPGSGSTIDIDMQSESYLGLEPTRAECFFSTCDAIRDIGMGTRCNKNTTVADNGC